jgi:uncharacterized membrane protein YbhN (UPF0104 family)
VTARVRRLAATAAGAALVTVALALVGWNDRVVDARGETHRGRLVDLPEGALARDAHGAAAPVREGDTVLRTATGDRRFGPDEVRTVRPGLKTAFRPLASRPELALLGLALHLGAIVLVHVRWGLLLRGAGLRTPMGLVLRLGWIGQLFASLLPGGIATGDVVQSFYVAREHPGQWPRAVSTVVLDRAIGLFVLALIALLAALLAPGETRLAAARPVLGALVALGLVAFLLLLVPRLRPRGLPLPRLVREAGQALDLYRGRYGTVLAAALLAVLSHALLLGAFALYAMALGHRPSPFAVLVAIPVAQMLSAIPGLPGGFGAGDLAFVALLPEAHVPAATALALSFTYRILHLLLALPAGFLLLRRRA